MATGNQTHAYASHGDLFVSLGITTLEEKEQEKPEG